MFSSVIRPSPPIYCIEGVRFFLELCLFLDNCCYVPVNSGPDDAFVDDVVCDEVGTIIGVFFRWRSLRTLYRLFLDSYESATGHLHDLLVCHVGI